MSDDSLHLVIKGLVQGVGFRWHIVDAARRLDLAGWVKNRADGMVELCACGSPEALARLKTVASEGPSGARVTEVRDVPAAISEKLERPFGIAR